MPRQGGEKMAGKPRIRYRTTAKPQEPNKSLKRRQDSYDGKQDPKDDLRSKDGYIRPGSQNRRK